MQTSPSAQTFQRIMDAIGGADRERALNLATSAWQTGDEQPLVLMLAAERLEEQGDQSRALDLLGRALAQEEDEPELWRRYGQLLTKAGRLGDSIKAFEEALVIDPDNMTVLMAAGETSYRVGSLRRALSYYERADALRPDKPEILAAMAAIHAGLQDAERAREFGYRALRLSPKILTAEIALARADLLSGDAEAALQRVSPLLPGPTQSRVALLDIAADALDALHRPVEAFRTYTARNAVLDDLYSPQMLSGAVVRRVDQARQIAAWLRSKQAAENSQQSDEAVSLAAGHAFVLGFPRSGTTLLEKSLAAHPDVATLPEIDLLENAASKFLQSDDGLNSLAAAARSELQTYRDAYWKDAAELLATNLSDKVLVDKLPLHTLALPLIRRLFPRSRIIFAIRDPRDVVLSCFRRRFQVNTAMYEFLALERAAAFYDAVMQLAANAAAVLPLERMDVHHEGLISNFELEMGRILQFIGLEWDDRVHGFADLAKETPRTPSDLQLAKGLNASGLAQWKRYRTELQPVMPLLEPWVRQFGYETSE
jgi:tetratricopeptide (TPR) repeat protein